ETIDEADTCENKQAPHNQRAYDSPKQYFVLMIIGHFEIAENHQEDEKIVDAERKLDDVAGYKFECTCAAMPEVHENSEGCGQRDPNTRPHQRFAESHAMRPAIQHPQVQCQHRHYKEIEKNPE